MNKKRVKTVVKEKKKHYVAKVRQKIVVLRRSIISHPHYMLHIAAVLLEPFQIIVMCF